MSAISIGLLLNLLLVLPQPQVRPEQPLAFDLSLSILATLHGADFALTRDIIRDGGRELNPFIRPFTRNDATLFIAKAAMMTVGHVLLKKLYRKNKTLAWIGSIALNVGMALVVIHNLRQ